jgi:allantoate deiminase
MKGGLTAMNIDRQRLETRMAQLSEVGATGVPGEICRLALSKEYRDVVDLASKWMQEAGMSIRMDDFGNLFGRTTALDSDAPPIMLGSHIDSQPHGGRFDGAIGVLGAIEVVQSLRDANYELTQPIEVVAFCDEEGPRWGKGMFGSRGMVGLVDPSEIEDKDQDGISRGDALRQFGCDPEKWNASVRKPGDIRCYLELHIEQGPYLESQQVPIGVVTGIAGPLWQRFELTGFAGHAGTVPMHMRKDAMLGCAMIALKVKEICSKGPDIPLVGNVGYVELWPGTVNAVPGKATFTLDLRDPNESRRDEAEKLIHAEAYRIAESLGLQLKITDDLRAKPKPCASHLIEIMQEAANNMQEQFTLSPIPQLASGAFHDATALADITDIGMIFVRCKEGISHQPEEFADIEDIAMGTELLFRTVRTLI